MSSGPGPDIAELLANLLAHSAQVTTLVGDRIRPGALEEGDALPAIRYITVNSKPYAHLGGQSATGTARPQFDAIAETQREANAVAAAIYDVLGGLAKVTLGVDDAAAFIEDCVQDNQWDKPEAPTPGRSNYRRVRKQDYAVTHSKPVPSLEPL